MLRAVLSLLKPRNYMFRGLDAGGDWSIRFPRGKGIRCYAVTSGQCWLSVEGFSDSMCLTSGDCVLLPKGHAFRFGSEPNLESVDAVAFFATASEGGVAVLGDGGDCFGISGYFNFAGNSSDALLSILPPVIHIQKEQDKATLLWCLERMMQELREPQPGGVLIAEHLAHMLLVQALRLHIAEGSKVGAGWFFGLADKQMRAAISAMHELPSRPWTLQELAGIAGMSRSTFAMRFKEKVGSSAMEYLMHWRMVLAEDKLKNSNDPISKIAPALGYESESAFSTAFKRTIGHSPRDYRRFGNSQLQSIPN